MKIAEDEFTYDYDSDGYTIYFRRIAIERNFTFLKSEYEERNFVLAKAEKRKFLEICNGEHWDYYKQYHPYCRIAAIIEDKDYN